jgi:hypothetical protein
MARGRQFQTQVIHGQTHAHRTATRVAGQAHGTGAKVLPAVQAMPTPINPASLGQPTR